MDRFKQSFNKQQIMRIPDWTSSKSYRKGEIVRASTSPSSNVFFMISMVNNNLNNTPNENSDTYWKKIQDTDLFLDDFFKPIYSSSSRANHKIIEHGLRGIDQVGPYSNLSPAPNSFEKISLHKLKYGKNSENSYDFNIGSYGNSFHQKLLMSLQYDNIDDIECKSLLSFLILKGGVSPFKFRPNFPYDYEGSFISQGFSHRMFDKNNHSVSFDIVEIFGYEF